MDKAPSAGPDLANDDLESIKGRDLTPALVARVKAAKPTWFVRRLGDGMEFCCEEKEAWDLIYNTSTWKRRDFQFFGFSDGKTYKAHVEKAMGQASKLGPEIEKLKAEIEKYRRAEERLLIDEAVDMEGDPEDAENEANKKKIMRLRGITEKLDAKLEALEDQYNNHTRNIVRDATAAERKVAVANWKKNGPTWPGAINIATPGVSARERNRILGAMQNQGVQ